MTPYEILAYVLIGAIVFGIIVFICLAALMLLNRNKAVKQCELYRKQKKHWTD